MRAEHAATRESTPRRISDLPGPAALPLLGNALEIRGDQLLPTLEQWSRDYGGVYRFRIA